MQTVRVGAEQLRRELADLLSRVSYAGDHIVVERHGTPQAVLIPYALFEQLIPLLEQQSVTPPTEAEFEQLMAAEGVIRAPERNAANQAKTPRRLIHTKGRPLSEIIIEERR